MVPAEHTAQRTDVVTTARGSARLMGTSRAIVGGSASSARWPFMQTRATDDGGGVRSAGPRVPGGIR